MPNEKNLIPFTERTESEAREISAKGGKKSGETRRRKRTMKQVMETLLEKRANTPDDWQLIADLGLDFNDLGEEVTNL